MIYAIDYRFIELPTFFMGNNNLEKHLDLSDRKFSRLCTFNQNVLENKWSLSRPTVNLSVIFARAYKISYRTVPFNSFRYIFPTIHRPRSETIIIYTVQSLLYLVSVNSYSKKSHLQRGLNKPPYANLR